jgi:hypothetical protein
MNNFNDLKSVHHNCFISVFAIINAQLNVRSSIFIIMMFNLEIAILILFGFSLTVVKNEKGTFRLASTAIF